jgi:hypothetical protein
MKMLTRNALPLPALSLSLAILTLAGATWAFAQQGRHAGSLTFDDYLQIQQLYSRYYHTIDAADAEGWAGTFTSDGVFNDVKGHDALLTWIQRAGPNRPLRHLHSNLTLTPTPEGVNGSVYVVQIDKTARPLTVASYSRYDDTLVRTPQGWRFRTRQRSTDTTLVPAKSGGD